MEERRRRTSLTPIGDELRAQEIVPGRQSVLDRWRRRRRRREPPTTIAGTLGWGLVRLAVIAIVATGAWIGIGRIVDRTTSFGLYCVGGLILASAIFGSAADMGTKSYYGRAEREHRVSLSFAQFVAGLVVMPGDPRRLARALGWPAEACPTSDTGRVRSGRGR